MSFDILSPPQILRCVDCRHAVPLTDPDQYRYPESKIPGVHRAACPQCGGRMRILCGGPCKRDSNKHCERFGKRPGVRCKQHGGNAAKGIAHGNYKHGKNSKFVLPRYAAAHGLSMEDLEGQMSSRHQIGVIAGMEEELQRRLETGESAAAWKVLQAYGQQLERDLVAIQEAGSSGTPEGQREAGLLAQDLLRSLQNDLLPVLTRGVGKEASRVELVKLYGQRARLISVEQAGAKTVPLETVLLLVAQLNQMIMLHLVDHPRARKLIANDLREMILPR